MATAIDASAPVRVPGTPWLAAITSASFTAPANVCWWPVAGQSYGDDRHDTVMTGRPHPDKAVGANLDHAGNSAI